MSLRFIMILAAISACACLPAQAKTALEFLQDAPKPRFRQGHTLPPLTRWGWVMPFEVQVELAERWGYCLEFGGYATPELVKKLDDPNSLQAKVCALTAANPKRYPLSVLTVHYFKEVPDAACTRDAQGNLPDGKRIWSPEAPDDIFREAAAAWADPVREIRERAPIAIVLSGGEYALSVYGHHGKYWSQDPKVLAAKGERDWYGYISESKARQERFISEAMRAAVPDRQLYLYYYTEACPHRDRYGGWWTWAWDYKWMRPISDIPNTSIYFAHFNSGWTGNNDMLTQALNSVTQHLQFGDALSYNWLNAGWTREKLGDAAFGDLTRYTGYLKCFYTAGMIGGVAGYFAYPKGGFGGDQGEQAPHWLGQMMALGHVHALFSHLEDFLRQGDLLPGPDKHRWSKELAACEFSTGDPDARVLARKHRERAEWLITAWAAGGKDRDVSADIPVLGKVALRARGCGSVYRARLEDGKPSLRLLDEDGMEPSRIRTGLTKGP